MPDDIAAAALRMAEHVRGDSRPHHDDLIALLPVLDAVAAGREDESDEDEARIERWRDAMYDIGRLPTLDQQARAAIALADAERA